MNRKLLPRLVIIALSAVLVVNCKGSKPPPPPVLVGLADFHTHQFGYLGFGGTILSHSVDPTTACLSLLPADKATFKMLDLVRDGLFQKANDKLKLGTCAPSVTDLASQRMDTDNLKRAWGYGLRLMVMFAVSSEFLCKVADLKPGGTCPSDREAIDQQIQAAKDLEAQIDAASGGPGQGWYRIVFTPAEARQVIGAGKLAVVLGVEASNAFGCTFESRGTVNGVPNLFGTVNVETAYQLYCGVPGFPFASGTESYQTQIALALFEHYWKLGVRHFFPIHNLDGTAGGTALSIPLLHRENNPSRVNKGPLLDRVMDIDRTISAVRPQVQSWSCSRFEFDDSGRCNSLGLTETGRSLIKLMASYGAVIDIDHMSWKAKRELLADDGLMGGVYPFVSSHSGIQEINHGDKNNEGQLAAEDFAAMIRAGGSFAPILPPVTAVADEDTYPAGAAVATHTCGGTSETFVQAYRYVVDKLTAGKLFNGQAAFVGVGFGTDFGAPVPIAAAPRFDDTDIPATGSFDPDIFSGEGLTGAGGYCYTASRSAGLSTASQGHVTYPFTSTSPLSTGVSFGRSTTPWDGSTSSYDISFDGVIHEGMIPDFVEELHSLGLTDADLGPLWHGAEAYVRAWETSGAWAGASFNAENNDPNLATQCRDLRARLLADRDASNPTSLATVMATRLVQIKLSGCLGTPNNGQKTIPFASGDDMQPGEVLNAGQSISSKNGNYTLIYQEDGNLVLYKKRSGEALWASNTAVSLPPSVPAGEVISPVGVCVMQSGGSLVLYDSEASPIWSSDTSTTGNFLVVQDDGNMVIQQSNGTVVWATNTVQP
jgi:hypothetical protein